MGVQHENTAVCHKYSAVKMVSGKLKDIFRTFSYKKGNFILSDIARALLRYLHRLRIFFSYVNYQAKTVKMEKTAS